MSLIGITDYNLTYEIERTERVDVQTVPGDGWHVVLVNRTDRTVELGRRVAQLHHKEIADMVAGIYRAWVDQAIVQRKLTAVQPPVVPVVIILPSCGSLSEIYEKLETMAAKRVWIRESDLTKLIGAGLAGTYERIPDARRIDRDTDEPSLDQVRIWSPHFVGDDDEAISDVGCLIDTLRGKYSFVPGVYLRIVEMMQRRLVLTNWDGSRGPAGMAGLGNRFAIIGDRDEDDAESDSKELIVWSPILPSIPIGQDPPSLSWRLFA